MKLHAGLILVASLALTACAAPVDFNSPNADMIAPVKWTYWPMKRDYEYYAVDVGSVCFAGHGIGLYDRTGCVLVHDHICTFVTRPQDDHAILELRAICNGWKPWPL